MNRREFLISGSIVAGYALAAKPVLATAIRTPETGLATGIVEIPVSDGGMPAYFAVPEAATARPLALVVHEIFGVHEYIRDVTRRLARAGYFAIAPDLYQRQGDVSKLDSVKQILAEIVTQVPDEQVMADLDATRAFARQDGRANASRSVITGFCWGGRIVWLYSAHAPDIAAGTAWYGRLVGDARPQTPRHPVDIAGEEHAPVLGLYGTEDAGIPLASVEKMRRLSAAAGDGSEIILFPGAPHGFHADYRGSYREMPASEGWRRMLEWFGKHGATAQPVG
ncbi:MAG: dienelactone hydrolase family protein [Deltaproteobacteria bacterium]|nr:dienelactone hydrolase family protein [Deltaproteobacteria bacterium]